MDKKRFLINLMSNFLSALSGLGLSFFLTPYLVETLGKEAYGFYPLSNNFMMYAGIMATALNSMSGRFIAISLEKKNIKEVNVYFNSVLVGNMFLSLFFVFLGVVVTFYIDKLLVVPSAILTDIKFLFAIVFINLVISISSAIFSVIPFVLNRLDFLAFISIIANVMKLGVITFLFYLFAPQIYFLSLAAVFNTVYFFYMNFRMTKKLLPEIQIDFSLFSYRTLVLIISAGVWNSVLAISNVINTQLDLLISNRFFGPSEMGLLSLTKFVPTAIQVLLGIIVPTFLPDMMKAYANNDLQKLKEILTFSFKIIFLVALIPMAIFFVYGGEFFKLWLPGQDYRSLYYISVITLIPFVVHGTIETVYHVFVVTNKLKLASFWGIFISLFNFLLVIILSKYSDLGLYSIPVAALCAGLISHFTFTPWYASFCLGEKKSYFFVKMIKSIIGFVFLILISFLWKCLDLIHINSWMGFILNMFIIGIVLLVVSVMTKFNRKTLLDMMQKVMLKAKMQ
ncbi:lipopolysaccharide biosynthesis protein [Sphingobacterium spiritivorum]|uniref:lipopolysaccharide biosynthesis protein n=1 Tax=Sphingobacterium spiritivorum TaxID=258 RepID=UPI003DA30AA3